MERDQDGASVNLIEVSPITPAHSVVRSWEVKICGEPAGRVDVDVFIKEPAHTAHAVRAAAVIIGKSPRTRASAAEVAEDLRRFREQWRDGDRLGAARIVASRETHAFTVKAITELLEFAGVKDAGKEIDTFLLALRTVALR